MEAWRILRVALRRGRLAHAYLFVGAPGQGQEEVLVKMVQALHCAAPSEGEPCGRCVSCRLAREGRHPALRVVTPQGESIGIQRVREALQVLTLTPRPGEHRVVAIPQADRLTADAANRLLKVLEEPPPRATFVLMAEAESQLPETVVSRCQVIFFRALPEEQLVEMLVREGASPQQARVLARLSGGWGGRAKEWYRQGLLEGMRRCVLEGLTRLASGDPLEALAVADEWAKVEPPEELWGLVEAVCRDLAVLREGAWEALWNLDVSGQLADLAAGLAPRFTMEGALRITLAARRALEAHAPRQLVAEVACTRLQELMAG